MQRTAGQRLLLGALGASLSLAACAGDLEVEQGAADSEQTEETESPSEAPKMGAPNLSWEEFKAAATKEYEGKTFYVVEWDIGIHSEEELRKYYDEQYRSSNESSIEKAAVNTVASGADDVWTNDQELRLTYCVSNDFGANKARAVAEMNAAARAWEDVANVDFEYVSAQDGSCTNANTNVVFAVRPWNGGGACAFVPSGPACVARTVVMDFPAIDNDYEDLAPNMTSIGTFTHELGHTLGLRHEHTRPESGTCFENNNWRALTAYDADSTMHYPWCNGVLNSDLSLTDLDGRGMRQLYGQPAAWYEPLRLALL